MVSLNEGWNAAFEELKTGLTLDSSYVKVVLEIEQHMQLLKRQSRTTNPVWKRNRNLHARLLLEQLRAGRLAEPFERPPPDGPLRTLGAWALAPYLSRCRSPARLGSGSCAGSPQRGLRSPARPSRCSPKLDAALGACQQRALELQLRLVAAEARAKAAAQSAARRGDLDAVIQQLEARQAAWRAAEPPAAPAARAPATDLRWSSEEDIAREDVVRALA
ncbi:hypothetical protein WJX81_003464 [Elliptochloris bilobata]|uniref:DUF4485 domain-containing protein n=1 Tax=Elliptochloris bilobata TaxID=381761 RepID=A0AAW1S1U1_9CHLO